VDDEGEVGLVEPHAQRRGGDEHFAEFFEIFEVTKGAVARDDFGGGGDGGRWLVRRCGCSRECCPLRQGRYWG